MHTVLLDGSRYTSAREVHQALQRMLNLPSWYGMNADALNDCLSERAEPVSLWIASWGSGEAEHALRLIGRVVTDNGGSVREV